MCMQSTIVKKQVIMQIQPKSGLLPEAFFLVANMLPLTIILIGYDVVQSLMFIHTPIVKEQTITGITWC